MQRKHGNNYAEGRLISDSTHECWGTGKCIGMYGLEEDLFSLQYDEKWHNLKRI